MQNLRTASYVLLIGVAVYLIANQLPLGMKPVGMIVVGANPNLTCPDGWTQLDTTRQYGYTYYRNIRKRLTLEGDVADYDDIRMFKLRGYVITLVGNITTGEIEVHHDQYGDQVCMFRARASSMPGRQVLLRHSGFTSYRLFDQWSTFQHAGFNVSGGYIEVIDPLPGCHLSYLTYRNHFVGAAAVRTSVVVEDRYLGILTCD